MGATVILGIANRKGYEIGYYIYIEVTIARKEERDLGPVMLADEGERVEQVRFVRQKADDDAIED